MNTIRVPVKALPDSLRAALASVNYHRLDIGLETADSVVLQDFGSTGCRSFVCIVDLASGENKVTYGSWGGPNAYAGNAVDCDSTRYEMYDGVAIIRGSEGGGRPVYATITLASSNVQKLLPPAVELTERERTIMRCMVGYTPAGRKNELERAGVKLCDTDLSGLESKGLIKRNRAGAVSITTDGKNAIT